jgi:iron(III) transport system substrate-binding protein
VPTLEVVTPKDYTLITSRVAFVRPGQNPNAARLFLDYLVSHPRR